MSTIKEKANEAIVLALLKDSGALIEAESDTDTLNHWLALLMDYWKTLPEEGAATHQIAQVYARVMIRLKVLGVASMKPKGDLGKAQEVFDSVVTKGGMLALEVSDVEPIVKIGTVKTLHEVLAIVMAVRKQEIMVKFGDQLTAEERSLLSDLLDAKIDGKIKARLGGKKGEPYQAAFAAACAKHQVVPVEEAAPTVAAAVAPVAAPPPSTPTAKAKPKKKTVKAAGAKAFAWIPCTDWMVTVPATCPVVSLRSRSVALVSTMVADAVAQIIGKERASYEQQGLTCPDVILQHNALQGAVNSVVVGGANGWVAWLHGQELRLTISSDGTVAVWMKEEEAHV